MLRIHAVRSLLIDDVARLHSDRRSGPDPIASLRKAGRRALSMAILDWAAILVLFLLRDRQAGFLEIGATEQGLFALGILAVATHAGFRLGQREKYSAVERALAGLPDETAEGTELPVA